MKGNFHKKIFALTFASDYMKKWIGNGLLVSGCELQAEVPSDHFDLKFDSRRIRKINIMITYWWFFLFKILSSYNMLRQRQA